MAFLAAIKVTNALLAIVLAKRDTWSMNCSEDTRWAMAYLFAYPPVILSPVNIYLIASFSPIILVSRCVPPIPGINPKLTSGKPKDALSEHTIVSHNNASSKPPPKAFPLIAAMIILFTFLNPSSSCSKISFLASVSYSIFENILMSAPAQNILGN